MITQLSVSHNEVCAAMVDPAQLKALRGRTVPTVGNRLAYIPDTLPPTINYSPALTNLLAEARGALGRLDGIGVLVSNVELLVTPYIRIEAMMSSRIEGTQTTLPELLESEAAEPETAVSDDVREVRNYIRAMERGLQLLDELPLSNRLVQRVHEILLTGVRGQNLTPGEFRTLQVHVGRYTPPPANFVAPLMDEWEAFLATPPTDMPVLVQCAVTHYYFEAIHPFFDGNGRIGRLLITLMLCERGVLAQPLLYLSAYLEANRREYFDGLYAISEEGDWHGSLEFFFRGILMQARRTVDCCREIVSLREQLRQRIAQHTQSANALTLLDLLFENPFITATRASRLLGVTSQTGRNLLGRFESLGIVEERGETSSGARQYCAVRLLDIIQRAAEAPGSTEPAT
ncbi:MAG: Fic family protein [Armatimonadota bacterium]